MNIKRTILVLGGTRSGKSEFAEQMAVDMSDSVTYIATLKAFDDEFARRVNIHRSRRPAKWDTVEEPLNLSQRINELGQKSGIILIDCLTGWLTNIFLDNDAFSQSTPQQEKEEYIMHKVEELAGAIVNAKADILIVSNEVGMGVVPPYPAGRAFRDVSGKANRLIASKADEVYLVVAGLAVEIKSLAVNKNFIS